MLLKLKKPQSAVNQCSIDGFDFQSKKERKKKKEKRLTAKVARHFYKIRSAGCICILTLGLGDGVGSGVAVVLVLVVWVAGE